jgi:hypothetical protein
MIVSHPIAERTTRIAGAAWLAWALLLLALLRIGYVVGHEPLAGYANQYDMLRTSACIGWWPDLPEAQPTEAHPAAPLARYRPGPLRPDTCYPSSEVALAAIGFALGQAFASSADGSVSLAAVGGFKALLLVYALLAVQWRLRHRHAGIVHALLAAGLLADPFNTLWLNTLYTEFGALLGAWLALAGLALRALERERRGAGLVWLLIGIALTAGSRVQHLLLGPALILIWYLIERTRPTRAWAAPLAALGLCALAAAMHFDTQQRFAHQATVNRINALFGAMLPASADAGALLERLGLPERCAELAHVTGYLAREREVARECPEALALGHSDIALALLAEPRTPITLHARALLQSAAWRMPYVGELAGRTNERLASGPLSLGASLAAPIAMLPAAAHLFLWLGAWIAALIALLRLAIVPRRADAADAVIAGAGLLAALVLATAVMGDGYSELARHVHLGANAVLITWTVLIAAELARRRQRWPDLAIVLVTALPLSLALLRLPLAFGVLTEPRGERFTSDTVRLEGWVLDATAVDAVEVQLPDGPRQALTLLPAPDVAPYYPLAGGGAVRRFEGTLNLPSTSERVPIAIIARRGAINTVIDRRWLIYDVSGDNRPPDTYR